MHSSRITLLPVAVACWLLMPAVLIATSDAARINEAASGLVAGRNLSGRRR